jgi:hypothetical protein
MDTKKPAGRPPTTIMKRLDALVEYVGPGIEYTQTDEQFAAIFHISQRQFQRVLALGRRLGKLESRLVKVNLGQGWHNCRTIWGTTPLPYLGDGEVVEPVAPLAQPVVVPEVKAADPEPVAEPVVAEYFGEPEEDTQVALVAQDTQVALVAQDTQVALVTDSPYTADSFIAEFGDPTAPEPVAPPPVKQSRTTPVPMPLRGPLIEEIIHNAVLTLRNQREYLPQREDWVRSRDIEAEVVKVAHGRAVTVGILDETRSSLAARAIKAHHPRQEEIHLVRGHVLSHLRDTHPDDEAEKLHDQIVQATTRDQFLAALDAVTGDFSEFIRAREAAHTIIRAVIPGWEPAPVQIEAART